MATVEQGDPSPILDNIDIDLFAKVFVHTALSPFFIFFIPVFYKFQGYNIDAPVIKYSALYFVVLSIFWLTKWLSTLYRNGMSLFYGPKRYEWGDQVVLVTGGASGIGELIANTLAVRGVTTVVLDVNPIVTDNYNIAYYKCDVSKWEEVEAVQKTIAEEIGDPTVIINNAGVVQGKLITELTPDDVRQTFDVNVLSHFWILKAFLPEMIKNRTGHVVTMSSVLGLVGVAQMADYAASKAAIISLNESLRYELDKRHHCPDIRTSVVIAGHVLTPMFSRMSLPSKWMNKFFTPSLPAYVVAKAVIAAIDDQESRIIYLPLYTQFVKYVTLLPSFLRDVFQTMSGADFAMRGFVKVSGRRRDEGIVPPITNGVKDE